MPKTDGDAVNTSEQVRLLHDNFKPRWGPESILMYSVPGKTSESHSKQNDGSVKSLKSTMVSKGGDIRFAKIGAASRVRSRVSFCLLHPIFVVTLADAFLLVYPRPS